MTTHIARAAATLLCLGMAGLGAQVPTTPAPAPVPIDTAHIVDSVEVHRDPRLLEFEARARNTPTGHFLDEETIASMHLSLASDALRRVPGISVLPSRGIGNLVRIRGCAPLIWVGGQRARGAELDEVVRGGDIAAMEVYSSSAGVPAEYADRTATCGTILVWLRSD